MFVLHGEGWGFDPQAFPIGDERKFACLLVLNKEIKVCLGWDEGPPRGSCCLMQEVEG